MHVPSKTQLFIDGLKNNGANRSLFLNSDGEVSGKWQNLLLTSVFQPIYRSTDLTTPFAYEAFVRCNDHHGNQIKPKDLFGKLVDHDEITNLDRLCRTIHLLNFTMQGIDDALLFLNVHEGLISAVDDNHGSAFRKVVDALGFSPNRIVIELPISLVKDKKRLHFVLQNYRLNSLEVAINIDSIDDIQSFSERANIHFIKIASHFLKSEKNVTNEIEKIKQASNDANIVITKNFERLEISQDFKIMVQGDFYGDSSSAAKHCQIHSNLPNQKFQDRICLHIGG
jgi:EAL domain-containing protein (putative c-di-GMP-specific phosphodiesterase class I)